MDFCFLEEESIRKFTCALVIVDAKVRKMWTFNTPGKRPPLATIRYFLEQLKQTGRQVLNIRTDLGGELARSSEFCNFSRGVQMWLTNHRRVLIMAERKSRETYQDIGKYSKKNQR